MKRIRKRYSLLFGGVAIPWALLGLLLIVTMIRSHVEVGSVQITANMIDASKGTIKTEMLIEYVTFVVTSGVIGLIINFLTGLIREKINLGVRVKLWNKLMRLPTRFYDEDGGGSLVTRVTTDTDVAYYYFTLVIEVVTAIYAAVVAFQKLWKFQSTLALWTLLLLPVMAVMGVFYCKLTNYAGGLAKLRLADMMGYLHERVRGFRLIRSARTEEREEQTADPLFRRQFKADFLLQFSSTVQILAMELLACVSTAISFIIGGRMVAAGTLTVGRLIGVYTLSSMLCIRFVSLFIHAASFSRYNGTLKRVADILDTPDEPQTGRELDVGDRDIVLRDVSFSYNGAPVLRNVSCVIPKGRVTAVVGPNGAGKTTLFKLLERLYDPGEGGIAFGETDVSEFSLESWRRSFAIVAQDKPLISGTVRENILYGVERDVDEEELLTVARAAGIYDFVMATPGGFDAEVGPGGQNFSGGQQQCIAIARAMMRNPDYLLLDEATSNLDVKSEQTVSRALSNLMEGRTTVMIAHSYAATLSADYVLVMRDGAVEAFGTPEELLKTNEYYQIFARRGTDEIAGNEAL